MPRLFHNGKSCQAFIFEGLEQVGNSESTTPFGIVNKVETVAFKENPSNRQVKKYIKEILLEVLCKSEEHLMSHFGEWCVRIINGLKNSYGLPQDLFLKTAENYINNIQSFTVEWTNSNAAHINGYSIESSQMGTLKNDMEEEGEFINKTAINTLKNDDWNEGGYMHYLDREELTKEPLFDDFEYVVMEQLKYFDDVGLGLPMYEQYELHMALPRLAKLNNVVEVKFWGKIFGLFQDYYVAEVSMKQKDAKISDSDHSLKHNESDSTWDYFEERLVDRFLEEIQIEQERSGEPFVNGLRDERETKEVNYEYDGEFGGEGEISIKTELNLTTTVTFNDYVQLPLFSDPCYDNQMEDAEEGSMFDLELEDKAMKGKSNLINYRLPNLPQIEEKTIKSIPMENPGEGVNKYIYFVTNDLKTDWIRLPHVTPEQIISSRQIKRFFTGYLTSTVNGYPEFPGLEIHLLRTQIARISASTQVSPAGYFRFNEEEEGSENIGDVTDQTDKILINKEFEPLTVKDLTDPTCAFWVHHSPHILKQGRTVWHNVNQLEPKSDYGGNEGPMNQTKEAPPYSDVLAEMGPPLLTSCAEDLFIGTIPPWTVKPAVEMAPHEGCVYIRSNLWPGSYSFAFGRKIGFMYVGWGFKIGCNRHTPLPLRILATEKEMEPNIIERSDPATAQEKEYNLKLAEWLKKQTERIEPMLEEASVENEDPD